MLSSGIKKILYTIVVTLIAIPSYSVFAGTINGHIKDADTGENLPGVRDSA